jgi:hypothetical protein
MKSTVTAVRCTVVLGIVAAACFALPAAADTTDVKSQSWVYVKKTGAHCKDDPNCVNRYHPAIKPVARAQQGQLIVFETLAALKMQYPALSETRLRELRAIRRQLAKSS